jgi:uncharacterized membrane-anchored protein YhcB (DUF1043 family)
MIGFLIGLVVGFVAGALVFRNNKAKGEAVVSSAVAAAGKVKDKYQER